MEVPTSYIGFKMFGLHTGNGEDFINRCKIWVIFENSALRYTIIIIIALQNVQRGKRIEMGLAVISSVEASAD